jgi:F0F1-type ATP synthase membrane subunit b/b'
MNKYTIVLISALVFFICIMIVNYFFGDSFEGFANKKKKNIKKKATKASAKKGKKASPKKASPRKASPRKASPRKASPIVLYCFILT